MKVNKFYYNPLPDYLEIKKSKIDGMGIFAKEDIERDTNIGITHVQIPILTNFLRTPLGGFINHSEENNCYLAEMLNWDRYKVFNLFSEVDILKGEEITLNYHIHDL
jgi:hypothetical protein|tara:strand:+ start:56 stop:376 length:321 start_codon:yes stop_codon:yes gene_type:complete